MTQSALTLVQRRAYRRATLAIITLGVVWGATFMFIELALRGVGPFWLAAYRLSFAALLSLAVWSLTGFKLFDKGAKPSLGLMILIGVMSSSLPFALLSWGQTHVTSGFAGVSMAAVALIVLPLAHFFVPGERLNGRKALGFGIGFLGVVLLIGPAAFASTGAALEFAGRSACLGAAACYAVSSVLMRRLPGVDPIGLSTVLLLIGGIASFLLATAMEGPPPLPDGQTVLVLAVLGLLPTAAANFLRVYVIRSAGPSFMSLVNFQVPMWSVLFSALLLGETVPANLLPAMALILVGMGIGQWRVLREVFKRD